MFRILLPKFMCLCTLCLCCSASAQVDLRGWQFESYPNGIDAPPNWVLGVDGRSVRQTANGEPTVFVSDVDSVIGQESFQVQVDALESGDDDFFGFVLGFEPGDSTNASPDYLLVDWKRSDQVFAGNLAQEGLAISRVTGVPADSSVDFWEHSGQVEELQRAVNLGSTGWSSDEQYTFDISISENSVVISVNGTEEFNLTGNFSDGRLAFYAYAQDANFATNYGLTNLGSWQSESYPNGIDAPPNWVLGVDGRSVRQTANGEPTVFVSDVDSVIGQESFQVQVDALESGDDDFFGFVLGFEPGDSTNASPDYLLVDWKRSDQVFAGNLAQEGLAISRVTGVPADSSVDFWEHSGQVEELQRAVNLGSTGWSSDEQYTFDISISENSVVISVNGTEEFNLTGNFSDGRLAFYAYAQDANFATNYGSSSPDVLYGDVNLDGVIDFLDIAPFISVLASGVFQAEADIDMSGEVNFLDIAPFINILSSQ